MAETLLQSHTDLLQLLPALPENWASGRIRGLRARGALSVDLTWADHALTEARITPEAACTIRIAGDALTVTMEGETVPVFPVDGGFAFSAQGGKTYMLR